MKIAVLSGKGGTGKTFVSVNLSVTAGKSTYVDCDVEEPNGRLFLKPDNLGQEAVHSFRPEFDETKCTGCRKCVNFCRFNALVYVKNKPMIFPEICHSCGGCSLVCPMGAVTEIKRSVGIVELGQHSDVHVVTGILNTGEISAVPVIKAALNAGYNNDGLIVVDCPPGSGCAVIESVTDSDYCILVVEPTAFGLHNFKMVYELVRLLKKPCGVVINKENGVYSPLEDFCVKNGVNILSRIPYSENLAKLCAGGQIAVECDDNTNNIFKNLIKTVLKEVSE